MASIDSCQSAKDIKRYDIIEPSGMILMCRIWLFTSRNLKIEIL